MAGPAETAASMDLSMMIIHLVVDHGEHLETAVRKAEKYFDAGKKAEFTGQRLTPDDWNELLR